MEQFVDNLVRSGLLTAEEVQAFIEALPPEKRPRGPQELASALHHCGKLTRFQAQAVYQGQTRGLVMGNYVLLDRLGQGGMGMVYKARHRRMARVVALKVAPSVGEGARDSVRRFQREVRAAARLSHPNIVSAHDSDEVQGVYFLVMEYVEGEDLSTLVKKHGPLPWAKAVDCVLQTARGLEFAHARGVIHRDIKPSNLLLDKDGHVKILDMGLARIEQAADSAEDTSNETLTSTGELLGTLDYLSPEQAADTHSVDGRADIYSLGCTLFYLITGRPVYEGKSPVEKIVAHRQRPVPSLRALRPDVPESLDVVFQQMVAKRPDMRQPSMRVVIAHLEGCLAGGISPKHSRQVRSVPREPCGETQGLPSVETLAPGGLSHSLLDEELLAAPVVLPNWSRSSAHVRFLKCSLPKWLAVAGATMLLVFVPALISHVVHSPPAENGPPPDPAVAPFDAPTARRFQESWAQSLGVPVEIANAIGMKLVFIPPGQFQMGSSKEEMERLLREAREKKDGQSYTASLASEDPQHLVTIERFFYLAVAEVTQGQYQQVIGSNPSACVEAGPNAPVESVSWNEAIEFCRQLSALPKEKRAGHAYRLPTEAEWEYACRAGTQTTYLFGAAPSRLDDYAWWRENSGGTTHSTGQRLPNPWGLHDILGNVSEWCADWFDRDYYARSSGPDVGGPRSGTTRVFRGASWNNEDPRSFRTAVRDERNPDDRSRSIGFRVALEISP